MDKRGRVHDVSLDLTDGQTLVILGPSGAGKTSLLRLIAGLDAPDGGSVNLDTQDVTNVPAQRRRIAFVFEHDALFPHMTIYQNLAFAAAVGRAGRGSHGRIHAIAKRLNIEQHLQSKSSHLSGGQRQRAALARALMSGPRVVLLDEPLAHLDPQLRAHVRRAFIGMREVFSGPAIHVTHDHVEALSIGERLAIMIDGRIAQIGAPRDVYERPADVQVARFFGSPPMNLLDGEMDIVGIRPEHVRLDEDASLRGTVTAYEFSGADAYVSVRTARGPLVARVPGGRLAPAIGTSCGVALAGSYIRRFDRSTGRLRA